MAVPTITIEAQLDLSALALKDVRAKLYEALFIHNNDLVKKCIWELEKRRDDLNRPWAKPADKYSSGELSPIDVAVQKHNVEAMRLLFNTGKINSNIESYGRPLMVKTCATGNEEAAALVLKHGGSIHAQTDCDTQPLHEACFSSIADSYTVISNSDWGDSTLKRDLISWWKDKKSPPPTITTPLRARWPGSIPLVAFLLKEKANPSVEESSGFSVLQFVQDPTLALKNGRLGLFELKVVKFISQKDGILTFAVTLRDREGRRKIENVTVEYDVNMVLPKDVVLSAAALQMLKPLEKRTLKCLIETYAPDKKNLAESKASKEVLALQQKVAQLHEQHVEVYKEHQDKKAYAERVHAIEKDKSSPVYQFYDTVGKELDRLLIACKAYMKDPKKVDKSDAISDVISTLSDFAPSPFNLPGKALAFFVKKYGERKKEQEQDRVNALMRRDHGPMCDELALILTEHFSETLNSVATKEKARKLALNAVGTMFVLMCDDHESISPLSSFGTIQKQLYEAVASSDFFAEKLAASLKQDENVAPSKEPSKSRSFLPNFLRSKSPDASRSAVGEKCAVQLPPAQLKVAKAGGGF